MKRFLWMCTVLTFVLSTSAWAGTISWTDWTSATVGQSGAAAGTISIGANVVGVNYTGDVTFAQTGSGINYWTQGSPAPYTGNAVVDNAPTASELIALSLSNITNTITFSQSVIDPIITIVSQGQPSLTVSYDFNRSFSVLSEGLGYWGDGSYNLVAGDILQGNELHCAIQFIGTVSSISWVASPNEYWHGITVGLTQTALASQVPEPSTMLLLGSALVGLVAFRKRFQKA